MQCDDQNESDDEINAVIDSILAEDKQEQENLVRKRKKSECQDNEEPEEPHCKRRRVECKRRRLHTGIEKSKRFSLRVMEAIRALHRRRQILSECPTACSTALEIVDFVTENYRSDGDVEAQVRTALRQTCCQGFIKKESGDAYRLIGPFACQITKAEQANFGNTVSNQTQVCPAHSPKCKSPRSAKPPSPRCKRAGRNNDDSDMELSMPSSLSKSDEQQDCREADSRRLCLDDARVSQGQPSPDSSPRSCRLWRTKDDRVGGGSSGGEEKWLRIWGSKTNSPRRKSPASEKSDVVGAIRNPARDIEAALASPEFKDDADLDLPDEADLERDLDEDDKDDDVEDEDDDDDEEVASNDSALRNLKEREPRATNQERDRELKRWIRNCRRECERLALGGKVADSD